MSTNTADALVKVILARKLKLQRQSCFEASNPDSTPTNAQREFLYNFQSHRYHWVTAGSQSGKSSSAARLISWLLEGSHPTFVRPKEWGNEPLLMLVMTRTSQMAEENIYGSKLRGLLDPSEIQEVRVGSVLKKVVHIPTGNTIIFQSFHSENEAREKAQGFVGHIAWIDEMPRTAKLIEELQRRVSSKGGYFIGTFTPKGVSSEIQKLVEAPNEFKKVHRFKMFDNPVYRDNPQRQAEVMTELAGLPPAYRQTILEGDWSQGDGVVLQLDPDRAVLAPEEYQPSWRHVEVSDPATQSKHGLLIAAQSPLTNAWYIIRADYLENIYTPSLIVAAVEKATRNLNIVKRVYDSAASWYANEARAKGLKYEPVTEKAGRKMETFALTQEALGTSVFIAPWCENLIDEINSCVFSDQDTGKIANAKKFHLLDCLRYFVDSKPKDVVTTAPMTRDMLLYKQYLAEQARPKKANARSYVLSRGRW
jgi:hypothetical protein